MDGFLAGPHRPQAPARHGLNTDRFHASGGRHVGDFRRPEGYHPVQQDVISTSISRPQQPHGHHAATPGGSAHHKQQASILNMTLPGGFNDGRQPQAKAHKAKHAKKTGWRKWGKRSAILLSVLVLLGGGFLGLQIYSKLNQVFKGGGKAVALEAEVQPELLKGEGDGRVNILLLGRGGDGHAGPDLTDTILVASIDPINRSSSLISIPRDLWVTAPSGGSSKINAVFANAKSRALGQNAKDTQAAEQAGVTAIQQVVAQVLGVPLHYYSIVDFKAFQEAVNTVGGVSVNVPPNAAVLDYMYNEDTRKPYTLNVQAGVQQFDGLKALMYARSRHSSVRGDFDRNERQRLLITALSHKVLSAGTYTNPVKVTQLMNTFGNHVATDFSINDMMRLMTIAKGIDMSTMNSVGLADPPHVLVRTDSVSGQSVVRPVAGIGDYSQIQSFIRNSIRDPYIAKENAPLMVLNGTPTAGLAGKKADELRSYGYNVLSVGDAPTPAYTKQVLVDLTAGKKPFTKSYLEKRLGVKAVTKLPDPAIQATGADFVIILGE
jgi:LCP family protein required for cell wall assembly